MKFFGLRQKPESGVGWRHCGNDLAKSQNAPGSAHWEVEEHFSAKLPIDPGVVALKRNIDYPCIPVFKDIGK
jgi:hypothetical protein